MPRFNQLTIALATLAIVGGCKPKADDYYDLPPAVAFEKLTNADIVGFRDARQCGMLIYFTKTESAPKTITWEVTSGGIRALYFTFILAPSGDGTVITIDVPKAPMGGEFYDSEQEYHHPLLLQPLRPALRELIDSAMQGRAYDWQHIKGPLSSTGECSSARSNFQASGVPYDIHDPAGVTHAQAEDWRQRGELPQAEHDPVPQGLPKGTKAWWSS